MAHLSANSVPHLGPTPTARTPITRATWGLFTATTCILCKVAMSAHNNTRSFSRMPTVNRSKSLCGTKLVTTTRCRTSRDLLLVHSAMHFGNSPWRPVNMRPLLYKRIVRLRSPKLATSDRVAILRALGGRPTSVVNPTRAVPATIVPQSQTVWAILVSSLCARKITIAVAKKPTASSASAKPMPKGNSQSRMARHTCTSPWVVKVD